MKLLFIEDHPEFAKYTKDLLESNGYEVDILDDADEAVDVINDLSAYKGIILDIMLMRGSKIAVNEANETGIALYKRIRAQNSKIPILVLSAIGKAEIWHHFTNDRYASYHGKPILSDASEFLKKIKGVIDAKT